MKVVFLADVPNVAKAGDEKTVADGYGRNYLLPKNLAMVSQPGTLAVVKAKLEARAETEKFKKLAEEIDGKVITFKVKMGTKDRMHGSITAANVAAELQEVLGQAVDKRKIDMAESIKQLGSYDVTIKLAKGFEPKIKVDVIKKDEEPEKETAAEPEKKSE
jgi:large subunit ribosomal protein L9